MHSATIIIFTTVLGFFTCSDAALRNSGDPDETPAQVVARYVSFAQAGEFDKVESLVVRAEEDPGKDGNSKAPGPTSNKNANGNGSITVVPDIERFSKERFKWVAREFAESIRNNKESIKSVRKESSRNDEATVEVVLGNDNTVNVLGWVFRLRKVEAGWRIYDITTPADPALSSP